MDALTILALALGIGVIAGLRSLTAPAAVAWAAHLNWLDLHGSRLSFLGSSVTVGIVTLLAIGELIADKLPATPSRTSAVPLIARIVTGGLCGAAICAAGGATVGVGGGLGAVGGVVGAYGGYFARHGLVMNAKLPDRMVAVAEDLIAIGGGLLIVSRF